MGNERGILMNGRRVISNADDVTRLLTYLGDMPMPYTITVSQGKGRTHSQNSLVHMWFGEIAKQKGDETMTDIKGACNVRYGLPIRLRDEKFAWIWSRTGALMEYEQQCSFLGSEIVKVTSAMLSKELTEYMDAMGRDYRQQGFTLTDPEMLKYQDTVA